MPLFCSSSARLTWMKNLIFLFISFWYWFSLIANFLLSKEWIKSNNCTAFLALFDCKLPTIWSIRSLLFFLVTDHLSSASWILFSPKWRCPLSIRGLILSNVKVLLTIITLGLILSCFFAIISLILFLTKVNFSKLTCIKIYQIFLHL